MLRPMMDHIDIPPFAMLRFGTVILRLKKEKRTMEVCQEPGPHRVRYRRVLHRVSSCEQCTRTRILSQYSDCDSGVVDKCRPYRARAAKSRYVNVCAAVCLLLLVGGLTPLSSAAPHRARNMDRSRRDSDQENETWSNPCDYEVPATKLTIEYKPELAEKVADQANFIIGQMKINEYEEDFLKLHSYAQMSKLLEEWRNTTWLQDKERHSWWTDLVMPDAKVYGKPAAEEDLLKTLNNITEALPLISKALKVLSAGFLAVREALNPVNDERLQKRLYNSSGDMRFILCLTSDLMRSLDIDMLPLKNSEIPTYDKNSEDAVSDAFLIYRDSINFLEYIGALFTRMKDQKRI